MTLNSSRPARRLLLILGCCGLTALLSWMIIQGNAAARAESQRQADLAAVDQAQAEDPPYRPHPRGELTFNKHIAPIVFQRCAACHRPGEVAPFPLLSYRDVVRRGPQIKEVTASRFMPPWKALPGHGQFIGARWLTHAEIGAIGQWVDEGMTEGNSADLPPAPQFTAGWHLGTPDLIVTMPEPYEVPAEGRDIYRNFVIPLKIPAGKYIQAVEYRPSNRLVVHHAGMGRDRGAALKLDAADPGPGFTRVALPAELLPGSLAVWTPGYDPVPLPEGMSLPWIDGDDLVLQLHLHPSGKPEVEQSKLGFYLTDQPPTKRASRIILIDRNIDIAPGDSAYRTRAAKTLEADSLVYGVFPHMHLLGKEVKVSAHLPDGRTEPLLWITDWDFNWQNYYEYAEPVRLPKGTEIVMQCVHDNSAENPNNPHLPPRRVVWGEQTENEMSAVFLQLVAEGPGQRVAAAARIGAAQIGNAEQVMKKVDTSGDGRLDADEIAKIRPGLAKSKIEAELARFDKDNDGLLNTDELKAALAALKSK